MYSNRLRVYYGPEDSPQPVRQSHSKVQNQISVPVDEIFAAIADAVYNNRAWVADFSDEKITLPTDLYEVILAYQQMRRPSA